MTETGIVEIRGREYKTVALRVQEFRENHGIEDGWSIETQIVRSDDIVVIGARIVDPQNKTVATGYAEEKRGSTQINRTSALENCETSAIGRALSAAGYGGAEYASANEVVNAISQQNQPASREETRPSRDEPISVADGLAWVRDQLLTTHKDVIKQWGVGIKTKRDAIERVDGFLGTLCSGDKFEFVDQMTNADVTAVEAAAVAAMENAVTERGVMADETSR